MLPWSPPRSSALAAPALAALLALGSPAAAQDRAAAETLFDRGLGAMKAGDYAQACPALAESYRLEALLGTLFTLAECEFFAGKLASSLAHYSDYLELYNALPAAPKLQQKARNDRARTQRDSLAAVVPRLTLVLPASAPPGTVVRRDGTPMGEASLGVPFPVDPGEHRVTTEAPGRPMNEQLVVLEKGATQTVELQVAAAPPPRATAPPPEVAAPSALRGARVPGLVVAILGLAGVGVGVGEGVVALHDKALVDAQCPGPRLQCSAAGWDAVQGMRRAGLISTVGIGVGAAGLATGVILFLVAPGASPKVSAGFGAQPVIAAGPGGAWLGASGVW